MTIRTPLLYILVVSELFATIGIVDALGINLSAPDIIAVFLLTTTLLSVLYRRSISSTALVALIASTLIIAPFLNIGAVSNTAGHAGLMLNFAGSAVMMFFVAYWAVQIEDIGTLLYGILTVGLVGVLSAWVIALFPTILPSDELQIGYSRLTALGIPLNIRRTSGLLGSMGRIGSFVAAAVAILVVRARMSDSLLTSWTHWTLAIVLAIGAVLITQSRSGIVSCAVSVAAACYFSSQHRHSALRIAIISLFLILVSPAIAFLIGLLYRVNPNTVLVRWDGIKTGIETILAHPITGLGFGHLTVGARGIRDVVVHNAFIRVGVAFGLPGIIFYSAVILGPLLYGIRHLTKQDDWRLVSLVAASIGVLSELLLYGGAANPLIFMLVGGIIASPPLRPKPSSQYPTQRDSPSSVHRYL